MGRQGHPGVGPAHMWPGNRPHEKSGSLVTSQAGHFHAQVFPAPSSITRFPLHTPQCGQAGEYAPRPYVSSLTPGFNFFLPALRTCLAVTSSLWPSAAGRASTGPQGYPSTRDGRRRTEPAGLESALSKCAHIVSNGKSCSVESSSVHILAYFSS
jgi:hypothetical protein